MSERPTLTIAVTCPTCGGTGWNRLIGIEFPTGASFKSDQYIACPDCTDGTIRQAVSCAGCKWWERKEGLCYVDGDFKLTDADFGCLSWQAREGA